MSRGFGVIERGVLEALEQHHRQWFIVSGAMTGDDGLDLEDIVLRIRRDVDGERRWRNPAYRHAADSIRRALNALERKGLVAARPPDKLRPKTTWILMRWKPSDDDRRAGARYRQSQRARSGKRRSFQRIIPTHTPTDTTRLAKLIGMIGSSGPGERDNAYRMAEEERKRLGKSWAELLKG